MKHFRLLISIFLLTAICACKKEDNYQVDDTLNLYLQMFLDEAEKRGIHLNVEENGLIMRFDDLESPTIGLCTYTDPLLIQIDPTYWKEAAQYDNCENLRQDVCFHELAHGLLNRGHDNSLLDNTEWKTLMCGGDQVRERTWQVNFNGKRKEYYLDELFNPNTSAPEWSEFGTDMTDSKGDLIAELNLTNKYYLKDDNGNIYDVSNMCYTFVNNEDNNSILPLYSVDELTGDFVYETTLQSLINDNKGLIGIVLGYKKKSTDSNLSYNVFGIFKNTTYNEFRCIPINSRCMQPFAEIILNNISFDLSQYCKLTVVRKNSELYFYINDKLVYNNDWDGDAAYCSLGIIAPALNTTKISSASVYNLDNASLKSSKIQTLHPSFGKVDAYLDQRFETYIR